MYLNDIKLLYKNKIEPGLDSLRFYSQDIGMEFSIEMSHANNKK